MVNSEELVQLQDTDDNGLELKMATVVKLFDSGTSKIKFFGEDTASEKEYSYLSSYTPTTGDTVLLIPLLETYVIAGKLLYQEVAEGNGYVTSEELNTILANFLTSDDLTDYVKIDVLGDYAKKTDLNSYYKAGNALTTGNITHKGSYLGFFSGAPSSKRSVSTLTTTADLAATRARLNELINALDAYGLV